METEDEHMSMDISNKDLMQLKKDVIGSEEFSAKVGRYIPKGMEEQIVMKLKAAYFRERLKNYGKWYYQPGTFNEKFQK